jgi:hypothetical protein
MKTILIFIVSFIISSTLFYNFIMPNIIKQRASNLGLLYYNSMIDDMIPNDSLHICDYDLIYLQHGKFIKFK